MRAIGAFFGCCAIQGLACCAPRADAPGNTPAIEWYRTTTAIARHSADYRALTIDPRTGYQHLRVRADSIDDFAAIELDPASIDASLTRHSPRARCSAAGMDGVAHAMSVLIDTGMYTHGRRGNQDVTLIQLLGPAITMIAPPLLTPIRPSMTKVPMSRGLIVQAVLQEFQLGSLTFAHPLVSVDIAAPDINSDYEGAVGIDLLRIFDAVVFDWDSARVWLTSDDWGSFDFDGWISVPMLDCRPCGSNAALLEVQFAGERFAALIDTGSTDSVVPSSIFDSIRDRSIVTEIEFATHHALVGGESAALEDAAFIIGSLAFPVSRVDRAWRAEAPGPMVDGAPFDGDLNDPCACAKASALLGMNILRQRAFALDFTRHVVWFAPDGWQGPPRRAALIGHPNAQERKSAGSHTIPG